MRTAIKGVWYDGQSSKSSAAILHFDAQERFSIDAAGGPKRASFDELSISARLGNTPRRIEFAGGGAFETDDNDGIDDLIAAVRPSARPWVHRLEANWTLLGGAVIVLMLIAWATFQYGIPAASRAAAAVISPQLLSHIGAQTFAGLERFGLEQSRLPAVTTERIAGEFRRMLVHTELDQENCRLEFRSAAETFGPNAFALPPCAILITDELVEVAHNDEEIYAVLAHELGHIKHRHALRRIIQDAFLTFILMLMTGDTTQVSAALATIPAVLLEFGYARDFEREADSFALTYMDTHGIPRERFPAILRRIQNWSIERDCEDQACIDEHRDNSTPELIGYLATHPATEERARMFAPR